MAEQRGAFWGRRFWNSLTRSRSVWRRLRQGACGSENLVPWHDEVDYTFRKRGVFVVGCIDIYVIVLSLLLSLLNIVVCCCLCPVCFGCGCCLFIVFVTGESLRLELLQSYEIHAILYGTSYCLHLQVQGASVFPKNIAQRFFRDTIHQNAMSIKDPIMTS